MSVLIAEAEAHITTSMRDGSPEHQRLRRILQLLDAGHWRNEMTDLRQAVECRDTTNTADGLSTVLSAWYRERRGDAARAQLLAPGFYRLLWRLVAR